MTTGKKSGGARAASRCFWSASRRRGFLAGTIFLILNLTPARASQSVMLGWQSSSDPNAVGYRIYYGTASQTYTNSVTVGNQTSVTLDGLVEGATYYFAATTYNAQNQESGFSNEAVYQVPAAAATNHPPDLQVQNLAGGNFTLTINGQSGQSFAIEATTDFQHWSVIATVTIGAAGAANFTDQDAPKFPQRFYRTRPLPLKSFQPISAGDASD